MSITSVDTRNRYVLLECHHWWAIGEVYRMVGERMLCAFCGKEEGWMTIRKVFVANDE